MNPSPATPTPGLPRHTRIAGTGSMLPPRRLTNADLAAELAQRGVETSDDWIIERTGIRARHFVDADTNASDLAVGAARRALVIGAEVFSRILDFNDRGTCVLFGDGAGAVVLEASDTPGILATDLHADGRHVGILCVPGTVSGGQVLGDPLLKMDGQAVFKLAVGVLEQAARATLDKAGRHESDIDWLIPHQANIRIMQGTAKRLKLPLDKLIVTVDQHGNTSAASIPLALDEAVRGGRIQRGDTLMLEGVGGGFTWGAVLLDY